MARKTAELAEMNLGDLIDELRETKQEALNLRFRNATGQLENNAEIRKVRRQIARINTYIRAREIAAAEAGADASVVVSVVSGATSSLVIAWPPRSRAGG